VVIIVLLASVCTTITFEGLDVESSFWSAGTFQGMRVSFIYEGHWVKVKVTGQNNVSLTVSL